MAASASIVESPPSFATFFPFGRPPAPPHQSTPVGGPATTMDLTTAYRYNQNMMEYYTCKSECQSYEWLCFSREKYGEQNYVPCPESYNKKKKRSASIRVLSLGPCSWTAIRRHPPAIDFVSNSPPYKSTINIERKRAEVE